MNDKKDIFWFRRDLRLDDNAGLYRALKASKSVQPIFIFDRNILDKLEDKSDARVEFIHNTLLSLHEELVSLGSSLEVYYGNPTDIWAQLIKDNPIGNVFCNRDYEPYATERDDQVRSLLTTNGVEFLSYKDHVIFEQSEVLKDDGNPYVVFTPYKKKWLRKLESRGESVKNSYYFKAYPNQKYFDNLAKGTRSTHWVNLKEMGFEPSSISSPSKNVPQGVIKKYDTQRDFPAIEGTSKLGIHFRFGTVSIREKAKKASQLNQTYLSELIWRDFYSQILAHFPHVAERSFRAKYDVIPWRNNEKEFAAWCDGQTGYPIVDAGMRELNTTGHMHNRVRMIVASFLTKHLLIDWRWGEAYFAQKLLDFDLASNNGGWQWAAGCGTDAAPYFRIFNPYTQTDKFDKQKKYVKKWVPEFGSDAYVPPIVDHKEARERCLSVYKSALNR